PPTIGDQRAAKPFAGRTLTIACEDPAGRELLARHGATWAAETGAELKIVGEPFDPGSAHPGRIEPVVLPALAEAGRLAVLPDSARDDKGGYDWTKLLPIYRQRLVIWSERSAPVAVPVLGEARVLAYRSDLFDEAEHRDAFRSRFRGRLAAP